MLCLEAPQRSPPEMDSAILAAILPRSMTACGPARNVLGLRLQRDRFHRLLDAGRILHDSGAPLTRDHPVVARIDALLDGQLSANLDRLDTLEISDTPPMSTFKELLAGHGLQVARYGQDPFWEALSNMARSASRRTWEARVQVEAIEATRKGWFVVFDTITYDPNEFTDEVMYGPHWKRYLRAVQHSVVRSVYGSLANFRRSGDSFADSIRYFAVPEAHKDGRTHLHILWFLKDLPDCSSRSCPNQHRAQPTRREVSGWPQYPYGRICKRLAVRYTGDAFTRRLAWRWPVDAKTRQRIPARPVIAIARYMAKYLSKPRPETLKCRRIRTSPALGLGPIRRTLSTLTSNQLAALCTIPQLLNRSHPRHLWGIRIPGSLLKLQVQRELLLRFRRQNLPMKNLLRLLETVGGTISLPRLQKHFSISTLKAEMSNLQNFIDSLMPNLTDGDISRVRDLFTDVEPPEFFGHAPSSSPSLGVINNA